MELGLPAFTISELGGVQRSDIRSGFVIHRVRDVGVYRMRDDVGPGAGLEVSEIGTCLSCAGN